MVQCLAPQEVNEAMIANIPMMVATVKNANCPTMGQLAFFYSSGAYMVQCLAPQEVNEAMIANIPMMVATVKNKTLQSPNWYRDMYTPIPWPEGEGTSMQEMTFRGELPRVEEGFESWSLIDDPSGCGNVCAPKCGYNMHMMGGHAFQSQTTRLMKKDLRTPDYCIDSISNTRQYEQVFAEMVKNYYNQINFQKEINIGQNFMSLIAKKAIVDGGGFKFNTEDPYIYRPKGDKTLVALNVGMLEFLYETMRRNVDIEPYDFQNNSPIFAMIASPQLISRLHRDDPSLRADYRAAAASGGEYADNLVKRYNFTSTIRDMFFPVGYLWPRRYRWDGTDWVRVLPWVNGVPGIVGTYSDVNPKYEDPAYATHEEVVFHGRNPFEVWYQPTPTTIGQGTQFGQVTGFWDNLQWVNPQTPEDPGQMVGYFWTRAKIALKANNSRGIISVLVPRPPVSTMIAYYPSAPCPPEASACNNEVAAVGCPTPSIVSLTPNPVTAGQYFVVFSAPVDAEADDVIQLGHSNGGYVNATVVAVTADNKTFSVTISGTLPVCDRWTTVYTGTTLGCSAKVLQYSVDPADATRLDLILDRPIKADTASDAVTLNYGNGTQISGTVIGTPSMLTNSWKVDIGGSAYVDNVGGVVGICVPTATDATCPSCSTTLATVTQCVEA